ncbi:myophilin-like isoform X2 [Xenia sp. Carnegie-2017]|uniref:myophilin-like isoform X2 n=1 Tax=Xenia sp. Carnegie-2017 TaxID=2897299 RepID=UPI001F04B46A|nr:myophilin-like isoform X2 [Xenia sp. Carnegie-2017]
MSREFNRPMGYGFSREIKMKMDSKYDDQAEQNARLWMEDVTGTLLCNPPDDIETAEQLNEWRYNNPLGRDGMCAALSDGRYLCMLMNTIYEGAIPKFNEILKEKDAFRKRENIEKFILAGIDKLNCKKLDLFQVVDLYEKTNPGQVINGIYAVSRKAADLHPDWPVLGPKESKYSPRIFSKEQLKEGLNFIPLQMGTNKCASQAGMTFGKQRFIID